MGSVAITVTKPLAGSTNFTAPKTTNYICEVWAGGGGGGLAAVLNPGGGAAGGSFSKTNTVAGTAGSTVFKMLRAAASATGVVGNDSYISTTAVAPTSTAQGALAKGGQEGGPASGISNGVPGTGSTTGCIGDVKHAGGNGSTNAGGGGAGTTGAGGAASGNTAGTGTGVGGGNGGTGGLNPGVAGSPFGGGASGGTSLGAAGGPGTIGGARISWVEESGTPNAEWFTDVSYRVRITRATQAEYFGSKVLAVTKLPVNIQSEWFGTRVLRTRIDQFGQAEWFAARALQVSVDQFTQSEWNPVRGPLSYRFDTLALSEWFGSFTRSLQLVKQFDVFNEWWGAFGRSIIYVRITDVQSEWNPRGRIELDIDDLPLAGGPTDWAPNDGLKSISGIVFDHETGALVAGADVCLVRDSDAFQVGCVVSAVDGTYWFPRDTNDPNTYHTVVTSGSGQGRSDGGCVPA